MSEKHLAAGDPLPPLAPGKLRVYSMKFCPYAERTRLVLLAKEIPHETVNVNLASKPDWVVKKNPAGAVPFIEQYDMILNESLVTSDYLDEAYPQNPLHPTDPYLKAKQKLLVQAFDKNTSSFFAMLRATPETIKETSSEYFNKLEQFEKVLAQSGQAYFKGERPGMVDYMIYPWFERIPMVLAIHNIGNSFPKDRLPVLAAWVERMEQDPAVKAVAIDLKTSVNFIRTYLSGKPRYDD